MENRLYPMRELLGDLLLEAGQPQAAVRAYATALVEHAQPLSRALRRRARRAGVRGRATASEYFTKLVALAKNADTERPETRPSARVSRRALTPEASTRARSLSSAQILHHLQM